MILDPQKRFDDDKQLINDLNQDDPVREQARIRQLFWNVRFRRQKKSDFIADSFLRLWMDLIIKPSDVGKHSVSNIVQSFFDQTILIDVMTEAGVFAKNYLLYELTDGAKFYFFTCTTDSHYSSKMLGLKKLQKKEVAIKSARHTANLLTSLILIKEADQKELMIKALYSAWNLVFLNHKSILDDTLYDMDVDASRMIFKIIATK